MKLERRPVDKMQIAELAAATGFSTATLSYFEQVGLLEPAERSPLGYRLYGPREVERVLLINWCKRLGCAWSRCAPRRSLGGR